MTGFLKRHARKALILPPILIAVGLLAFATLSRQPPTRAEVSEPVRAVRIIEVPRLDVVPRALGYGEVVRAEYGKPSPRCRAVWNGCIPG